jgi:hypothetical protein
MTASSRAAVGEAAATLSRASFVSAGAVFAVTPGRARERETIKARDPLIWECDSAATSRIPITWKKRDEMQCSPMRITYSTPGEPKKSFVSDCDTRTTKKTPEGVSPFCHCGFDFRA